MFNCKFFLYGGLDDGSIVKEKFLEVYKIGIEIEFPSYRDIFNELLPKALKSCKTLGLIAALNMLH